MSDPSEERKRFLDLQNNYSSAERTIQKRLRAQKNTLANHHDQQMRALDEQFKETQRKRNLQRKMLQQRYQHQRQQMKQRHRELMVIKNKLRGISEKEHRQVEHEAKLRQRYERVQAIKTDFENREEKIKSNRDLLFARKNAIQKEMADLAALTGQIDQLNLGTDAPTEEQQQRMDDFVAQNPKPYAFDDCDESMFSRQSRPMRNRYSAYSDDDEESECKTYSEHYEASRSRRDRRDSRDVRRSSRKSGDRREHRRSSSRRTAKRLSLKMSISPREMEQKRPRSSTKSDVRSERRSRRRSNSERRRSSNVSRHSARSTRSRRDSVRSTRSRRNSNRSVRSARSRNSGRVQRRRSSSYRPRASRYESKSGNLYVRLVNARGVFGSKGAKANTYVRMECDGQVQESSMIHRGQAVRGDECFKFVVENYEESMLTIRLIDADRDDTIAKVRVPTAEFVDMADQGELEIGLDTEAAKPLEKKSTMSKIKTKLGRGGRTKRKQSR